MSKVKEDKVQKHSDRIKSRNDASGVTRGRGEFSESAALEILDYYSNACRFIRHANILAVERVLSLREQMILEQCFISLGAKNDKIQIAGNGPNTILLYSATKVAQKIVAAGIQFAGSETVPSPRSR